MDTSKQEELIKPEKVQLSVILPTYNESQTINRILDSIVETIPAGTTGEIIVVDDNSPDGTGDIANEQARKARHKKVRIKVIVRPHKLGLSSAVLAGVQSAVGEIVVVMDGDFSHPPQTIPLMVEELQGLRCDIAVASRYIKGGSVTGWPFKRKLMSKGATKIAQMGLGIEVKDPMSGFFAFRRSIIDGVKFDAIGFKMLLEILVKTKGAGVKELPYTFTNRSAGASKLDSSAVFNYFRAVWRLYRYGRSVAQIERRTSVRFLSKAGRFYSVGSSGLLLNYFVSILFNSFFPGLWYLYATLIGILFSMTSNFVFNKIWTFEDKDFHARKTVIQYGMFLGFSSLGALIQLGMVFALVEDYGIDYGPALILAVAMASVGNFLFNKKWTFKERIWS